MKSEMDLLRMDERQRLCWLMANRAVLFIVGVLWLLIIGWYLWHGHSPWVMIVLVPILAFVRLGFYQFYVRRLQWPTEGPPAQ